MNARESTHSIWIMLKALAITAITGSLLGCDSHSSAAGSGSDTNNPGRPAPSAALSVSNGPSALIDPQKQLREGLEKAAGLLEANRSLEALRLLENLSETFPQNESLKTNVYRLKTSLIDTLAEEKERKAQKRRVSVAQLPALDQAEFAILQKRYEKLPEIRNASEFSTAAGEIQSDLDSILEKNPGLISGWLLKARLALALEKKGEGIIAGNALFDLRAWETQDAETIRLLEEIDARGWMPKN